VAFAENVDCVVVF